MATLEKTVETATRPRPRFSRDIETPAMRLPAGKSIGAVLGVDYAKNGDIFIIHQPNAQGLDPGMETQPHWLPPVVHLTADGDFVEAWGGPDHIPTIDGESQWPTGLEGLNIDDDGNLWIFGYKPGDDNVLKFSPSGELLLQIGQRGKAGGNKDTKNLDRATSAWHDTAKREVYISDGYGNQRVIVFNSDTGEYLRMWGAYGEQPGTLPAEKDYASPVHRVLRGPNGNLFVADRTRSRVQEFEPTANGARFVREVWVAPQTNVIGTGTTWDIGFEPSGKFLYVADGANFRIWSVDMESFEVLGSTTVHTEHENEVNRPIIFTLVHRMAVEPNGDILLACVNRGLKRLKFEGIR